MANPSLVVLPFTDGSAAQDQATFCEGVANDLINALGNAANLRLAPRSAGFAARAPQPDVRAIGAKLGVDAVLHGELVREGDRLRLTAHLSAASTGQDIWARRYEGSLGQLFTDLDDLLTNATKALGVEPSAGRRFSVQIGTTSSIKAYDLYLKGLGLFHERYALKNCAAAREVLGKAVEIDPRFAKAWARLADCHSSFYMLFDSSTPMHWQMALEAARRAVEIAPELPLAHTALGVALTLAKDFDAADASFERATAMNPRYFEAYYHHARMTFQRGLLPKAAALFEKAAEVRPEDYQVPLLLRQVYLSLGNLEKAMQTARQGIAIAQQHLAHSPNDARAIYLASGSMIQLGMYKEAVEWAERALRIDPQDPIINYNVACCYAQAGEQEKAMDCLEKARRSGTVSLGWLKNDSDLVALIGNPRFQKMLKELEAAEAL
jgi:adenylate cyclase